MFSLRLAVFAAFLAMPAAAQPVPLADYAGYYRSGREIVHVSHQDGVLYSHGSGQPRIEVRRSGPDRFIGPPASPFALQFVRNRAGRVTGIHHEYRDEEEFWPRLSERQARAVAARQAAHLARRTPQPGTEAALRRHIAAFEQGQPLYEELGPVLARGVRGGLPQFHKMLAGFGRLESLVYKSTLASGADVFSALYEHGSLEWVIAPAERDGRIHHLAFRMEKAP